MDIGGSLTKIAYYSVLPFKKIVYDAKDQQNESSTAAEDSQSDAVYEVTMFLKFLILVPDD